MFRLCLLWIFAFGYCAIGVLHFSHAKTFVSIMPPYLPAHYELVYLSGAMEILGGLGLMFPVFRRWAGYGLILVLIGVFPANIHMTMHPEPFLAKGIPMMWFLYARLPFQFVLMYAIWWVSWATPQVAQTKT